MHSLWLMSLLLTVVSAQFQFFDQFFGGQQQQAQEPQNVASDSSWYQNTWQGGMFTEAVLDDADLF